MANITKSGSRGYVDPWREFFDIENIFNRNWPSTGKTSLPAVNVSEDDKNYMVDVVAPGFKKEDFKINVDDDVLTISAETKQESKEESDKKRFNRREYSYSSFTRSFTLPENAKDDEIKANYIDGILKLSIPKTEKQVKATKQIAIE